MILTENRNNNDSILFYLSVREALKESINISSLSNKKKLADYITNEMTDYEALSLLVTGKLPKEKYDLANEHLLLSNLKESILENFEVISEAVDSNVIKSFIFEVAPLFPDYSSNNNLLEVDIANSSAWSEVPVKAAAKAAGGGAGGGGIMNTLKGIAQKFGASGVSKKVASPDLANDPGWSEVPVKAASKAAGKAAGGGISGKAVIGGAVLAALLLYGAAKTYKRFFSQAAKACKGKSGREKTICMNNYRIKALRAQLADIKRARTSCSKSKDPGKCGKITGAQIKKIENKIQKIGR
jgi:hypothetical protein